MTFVLELTSEGDTDRLASLLAEHLPTRCIVALDGTLGAGKTRLVRGFAKSCGVPDRDVTSPTFTLWQTYEGTRTIHHLDAYRIQDEDEFDALGVEEVFEAEAVTFIEWAERIENCLPRTDRLSIGIEVLSESARRVTLSASDELREMLQQVADRYSTTFS